MAGSLRIVVADPDPAMMDYYQQQLPRWGHTLVAVASTGRELIQQCQIHQPGLMIADLHLPERDTIEAIQTVCKKKPVPVVIVSTLSSGLNRVDRLAEAEFILACLTKPVNGTELEIAIALATRRFEQLQALHRETTTLRRTLEERKVIERAKGIMMKKKGCDEETAFLQLQKMARNQNRKLVEMAQVIILTEDTLRSMRL